MPAAREIAALDQIAVGQQHRIGALRGFDARGVDGEIVGAVEEIGDAAETLRLALRAEDALRDIEPFQRVLFAGEISVAISSVKRRDAMDRQRLVVELVAVRRHERLPSIATDRASGVRR
jgi:hypothetical protein